MTVGAFWLRKNVSLQTYCQPITNTDFSSYNTISVSNVLPSATQEWTMEFWVYIYSYNTSSNNFQQMDIQWDLHTKISLINNNNSLVGKCYSFTDISNPTRYSEYTSLTLAYYKWTLVRCGTDLLTKQYYFNSVVNTLETTDIPTLPASGRVKLQIGMPSDALNNFGFVFIRQLKLWQQFNYDYIDTGDIDITPGATYPGLLALFKGNLNNSTLIDSVSTNQTTLTRSNNFIGYNYVDPLNLALYSDLTLCAEGYYYDSTTQLCKKLGTSHCLYPANSNDDCIACPTTTIFLNPADGTCVSQCAPTFFGNTMMNECRPCDTTCYQCTGIYATNCTACTGTLYLQPNLNMCIPNCETYGMTNSLTTPNTCTLFDATGCFGEC